MKNKKTAVEWLFDQLDIDHGFSEETIRLFNEAKEMEQEQLAKAEAKGADEAVESLWRMMNDRD